MPLLITHHFREFVESEKSGAIVLVACTLAALAIANSSLGPSYLALWQQVALGFTLEHWVNDALMAIFFLLIGLELERELYVGELSSPKNALLPILAAAGGILVPAGIHFALNQGTPTQAGAGIPMATDIAFALGALALLGNRIPASLKVFLVATAVMDDLGAIIVIAVFYATDIFILYLIGAMAVFAILMTANLKFRVMSLRFYLIGGAVMWYLMYKSGVHATIAGVLLAFAIPFRARKSNQDSPSHLLEHLLHRPVAFGVLPLFALANSGVLISPNWLNALGQPNSMGIIFGLILGKPIGIFLFSFLAVRTGFCRLPSDVTWRHVVGAGCLGGIGFTMSIFVTNLAFTGNPVWINDSKMAILIGSTGSALIGLGWLLACGRGVTPRQ